MSYSVSFFLTDIEGLRNMIGSKNQSIIEVLDIDDDDRGYAQTLIMGTEQDKDSGSEYGYALEKIIKHLGAERIDTTEFEDLHFGEFEDTPLDWIIQSCSPVKLPPNEDFPYIGHRILSEMQKALDDWSDEDYDNFEPEVQEMIEGMFSVFQTAIEKKKDLITFYY